MSLSGSIGIIDDITDRDYEQLRGQENFPNQDSVFKIIDHDLHETVVATDRSEDARKWIKSIKAVIDD